VASGVALGAAKNSSNDATGVPGASAAKRVSSIEPGPISPLVPPPAGSKTNSLVKVPVNDCPSGATSILARITIEPGPSPTTVKVRVALVSPAGSHVPTPVVA